jgi:peptide/nickel transport system permease protein
MTGTAVVSPAPVATRSERVASRSPWKQPLAVIGMTLVVIWTLVAILAPLLAPDDPLSQKATLLQGPSGAHWFGTDELGRDVFSRVLYGTRISLPLALLLVIAAMVIGAAFGGVAGLLGG